LDASRPDRKRSRLKVSEIAPFITDLQGGRRVFPDRERPFVRERGGAMLAGCLDSASASALCPTIFTSFLARGRAADGRTVLARQTRGSVRITAHRFALGGRRQRTL
jgi:hypothetical protein